MERRAKAASVSVGTFSSETMVRILVPEKVVAHLLVIRLGFLLNVDNESRCNHEEQTGPYPQGNQTNTATDVCAGAVLMKIRVLESSCFSAESRSYSSVSR